LNDLQIFKNKDFGEVRSVDVSGKPYFVANDIAKALGYSEAAKAIRTHCKGVSEMDIPSDGGTQKTKIIPEGDIYRLIVKSQLPSATKFESWVFDEVLPSVRKNGMYATDELLDNPDLLIKIITELKAEREQKKFLQDQVSEQQIAISTMKPKADYLDRILSSISLVTMTQISKDYGYSAKAFNKILQNLKIQYSVNGQWVLYAKYQSLGYVHSKTINIVRGGNRPDVKMQTEWTQKGRLFLYELLKKNLIYPIIEQPMEQYRLGGV